MNKNVLLRPVLDRLSQLSRKQQLLCAAATGGVIALGHAPFSWVWATIIGLFAAFVFLHNASTKAQGFWTAWAVGFGYFAVTLNWIVEPFLVDLARHGWMAPFALVLMSGGLAIFWGAAGGLAVWLAPQDRFRSVTFVATLAVAELARSYLFTGFPWGLLAYTMIETWIAYVATVLGPHGVGLILTLSVALAFEFALVIGGIWAVGAMLFMCAIPFGLGVMIRPQPVPPATDAIVRVLQPNAPQHQKWDPEHAPTFYDRQLEFTRAGDPVDLIVWPETAIPYLMDYADDILAEVAIASRGAEVVVGLQRSERARYYNSLVTLAPTGEVTQIYDKSHLVPFGEYIPLGNWLHGLGIRGLADVDGAGFAVGSGQSDVSLTNIGGFLPLICYEGIFPNEVRRNAQGRNLLLLITNDAWFGKFAGPQQHLVQAQFRAIETGLPMIRSANTGISAVIDPNGVILDQIPLGQAGFVDVSVPKAAKQTLYGRIGDLPIVFLALLGLGAMARRRFNR